MSVQFETMADAMATGWTMAVDALESRKLTDAERARYLRAVSIMAGALKLLGKAADIFPAMLEALKPFVVVGAPPADRAVIEAVGREQGDRNLRLRHLIEQAQGALTESLELLALPPGTSDK